MNSSRRDQQYRRWQYGQAMTEFAIVAAAVLVPLFLILPVLTKYGELSQTSVEMARYVAWERSVWHEPDKIPAGVEIVGGSTFPAKTSSVIANEAKLRMLEAPDAPILSQSGAVLNDSNLNPFLFDYQGKPLVDVGGVQVNVEKLKETPGIGYEVLRFFTKTLQPVYKLFSWLGSNHSNFSPNLDGYFESDNHIVGIPLNNVSYVVPDDQKKNGLETIETVHLAMYADSALLVDSWSAQGPAMFKTQTGGLVPSSFLNNDFLNEMRDVLSKLLLEPKLKQPAPGSSDGWDMGGYNTDPFNIGVDEADICDKNGVCSFND